MSRSERKRRYRARQSDRRRWRDYKPEPLAPIFIEAMDAVLKAQGQALLEALAIPREMLEGPRRVGLDFGFPNAAVVVADRTPDGKWIVKAD